MTGTYTADDGERNPVLALFFLALVLLQPTCPPVDPVAARCGQNDPTVDLAIYEACLDVFGYEIS